MDRTVQTVQAQLRAMGAPRFEVGVLLRAPDTATLLQRLREGEGGRPLLNPHAERLVRETLRAMVHHSLTGEAMQKQVKWIQQESVRMQLLIRTPEQLVAMVEWFRKRNAHGWDILVRTVSSVGTILVDDLSAAAVARMRRNGMAPAVVIETSPGNHQAWVAIGPGPIREELATAVARELAVQYGGDPQSAHWRHLGRLAGFTNQKPNRVIQEGPYRGLHPYVLLLESGGRSAPSGPALLARVEERLTAEPARPTPDRTLVRALLAGPGRATGDEGRLAELYRAQAERLAPRIGTDLSRLDWAVASDLRNRGHSPQEVAGAMLSSSPLLAERKAGHLTDYVERTVAKVFAQPPARPGGEQRAPPQQIGPGRDEASTSGR